MLDYPLQDVTALMRQHLDYSRRQRQRIPQQALQRSLQRADVVYRKADDSWF